MKTQNIKSLLKFWKLFLLCKMSSLQLHFIISLLWGRSGTAAVELKWVQASMYGNGISGKDLVAVDLAMEQETLLLWFFGALHLFSFSLSSSGFSLSEYQGFYGHMKPKFTVESYCLEGWRNGNQYDIVLNPQVSHSYRE